MMCGCTRNRYARASEHGNTRNTYNNLLIYIKKVVPAGVPAGRVKRTFARRCSLLVTPRAMVASSAASVEFNNGPIFGAAALRPLRWMFGGRGAAFPGSFRRLGRADRGGSGRPGLDGIVRVSAPRRGKVGWDLSAGDVKATQNVGFGARCPLMTYQRRRSSWARIVASGGGAGCPPSDARTSPMPVAHAIFEQSKKARLAAVGLTHLTDLAVAQSETAIAGVRGAGGCIMARNVARGWRRVPGGDAGKLVNRAGLAKLCGGGGDVNAA
jgi:hypothetical protein